MSDDNDTPVPESQDYDNFIGKKVSPMDDLFGKNETVDKEWKKHWVGMPEFVIKPEEPYKKLQINFASKEDFDEFQKLISQKMSDKTKIIWHPKRSETKNSLLRWIEVSDDE